MWKLAKVAIIEALKQEFQYNEENYQQWVMGVSLKEEVKKSRRITDIYHKSSSKDIRINIC